jgi:hypothetical protein
VTRIYQIKINISGIRFVHFFCLNRSCSFEQAMREESSNGEALCNKKLEITSPEEGILLNPRRQAVFSSD